VPIFEVCTLDKDLVFIKIIDTKIIIFEISSVTACEPLFIKIDRTKIHTNKQMLLLYFHIFAKNKKYVLWNIGICPIASKVGHVTLATPPLGSFIVPYVVLDMAYPTKKQELSYRKQIARQLHKH